jgi:serine/threonine-protein kinase
MRHHDRPSRERATLPYTITSEAAGFAAAVASRYALVRELGRGGMATVYLARDQRDQSLVAIKVLRSELAASIARDRFLREIELGKTLKHESIIGVLDSGEAASFLYYVMPFVSGESLRERLERIPQLPVDETLDIVRQVAAALDFAHARNVIHRDVKPENIMLDGNRAFVMDFGVAHAVTQAGGENLTRTGIAVGTPSYMSPEQAVGARDATARSDIYNLGCVVFEMLSGGPPFTGATTMAVLARHARDRAPSILIFRPEATPAIDAAVQRALAKDPADRFSTAGAFARALTDERDSVPEAKHAAPTGSPTASLTWRARLHRTMSWLGAAAATLTTTSGDVASRIVRLRFRRAKDRHKRS